MVSVAPQRRADSAAHRHGGDRGDGCRHQPNRRRVAGDAVSSAGAVVVTMTAHRRRRPEENCGTHCPPDDSRTAARWWSLTCQDFRRTMCASPNRVGNPPLSGSPSGGHTDTLRAHSTGSDFAGLSGVRRCRRDTDDELSSVVDRERGDGAEGDAARTGGRRSFTSGRLCR